jgi:excisionase family DNA binding protein
VNHTAEDIAAELTFLSFDCALGDVGLDEELAVRPAAPRARPPRALAPSVPGLDPVAAESARLVVREEVQAALREMSAGQRPVGDLFTTAQAAVEAGVKAKTIRAWVAAGLSAKRHGRRILITRQALDAWRTGESPQVTEILASLTQAA